MTLSGASGCYSETGHLRRVIMCPPTHFTIPVPTNATQWLYYSDGLRPPDPRLMEVQHGRLVEILQREGVTVELLKPDPKLPYQHATRDVGVLVGNRMVLSNLKHWTRQGEAHETKQVLEEQHRLKVLRPTGFLEGGDVIVDNGRLWVGIGARTDIRGAEFLYHTFKKDFEVILLRFDPKYTHLDTVFGVLSCGHALLYEPAFDPPSLRHIQNAYPSIIRLTDEEQRNAGANVLSLSPEKVISIAENTSVNQQLTYAGFQVIMLSYSEVIKSGGSVRCDTLPIERDT